MSAREQDAGQARGPKVTVPALQAKRARGEKIASITAYDYPGGRLADEAGIDLVLVGDSLAMVVLGYESTLPLTMDEMVHHAKAVRRGVRRALLVVDMPYGSYHTGAEEALRNAVRLVKEAGAEAVKLEGGADRAELVERMTRAEIPVVGHIGLTPQSLYRMGGYKVQGQTEAAVARLLADAAALEGAGAVALVLEGIPREVAAEITKKAGIPTIGIGAGPECDGQILVWHDALGMGLGHEAKFVRRFAEAGAAMLDGLRRFREAVEAGSFPADGESYHLAAAVRAELGLADAERPGADVAVG